MTNTPQYCMNCGHDRREHILVHHTTCDSCDCKDFRTAKSSGIDEIVKYFKSQYPWLFGPGGDFNIKFRSALEKIEKETRDADIATIDNYVDALNTLGASGDAILAAKTIKNRLLGLNSNG